MIAKHANGKWLTSQDKETNLSLAETRCKCGKCDANNMQQRIVDLFQALRDKIGKPLTILSGHRCAEHNKAVGGKPASQHLYGKALDIKVPKDYTVDSFHAVIKDVGITSCGRYYKKNFCHIDERLGIFSWTDQST